MPVKVAINGYGRIGRNVLRALHESGRTNEIKVVAVNDLGDAETNAHLTQYDTAHGKFDGTVTVEGDSMVVNGDRIRVLSERDPSKLPWGQLGVDVVFECTGIFTSKAKASAHLAGGAKRVLISAPGGRGAVQALRNTVPIGRGSPSPRPRRVAGIGGHSQGWPVARVDSLPESPISLPRSRMAN